MKKFIRISLPILAILLSCAMPGQAESVHGSGGGSRGGSGGHYYGGGGHYYGGHGYYYGGRWGWGPGWGVTWGLGYPYYGYPYYPYYDAAPVVVEQPATEVYVQPAQQQTAPSQPVGTGYWYYCQNPQGYYPYVKECPNGWMKVVPSPPPPQR
jgi:hypothetical protein